MAQILDHLGRPYNAQRERQEYRAHRDRDDAPRGYRAPPRRGPDAIYDAVQTTDENYKHWALADNLTPNMANNPGVRRTARNRARYEDANNCYCRGLISTIAHDKIGTGPRPFIRAPGANGDLLRGVSRQFQQWSRAANLPLKLRLMDEGKTRDGEGFAILVNNPGLQHAVQLDVRPYEADQVTTPFYDPFDPLAIDGMRTDKMGNPVEYHFLKYHPGGMWWMIPWEIDKIPAERVLHWFKPNRAGQLRGIPEILPALPLFAYLRRFTLATIAAAEVASMLAGIMKTNQPAADGGGQQPKLYDAIELVRGALLSLPEGWEASQFTPTQPMSTYKEFKAEILNEIARAVNATFNVISGNSSGYNYSSGRLDHQIYHNGLRVERGLMVHIVLDKIFRAWLDEAALIPGVIPDGLPLRTAWTWDWYWDGFISIDPLKDATANQVLLASNQTTLEQIYAEADGQDWETAIRQRAREIALCEELGVPVAAVPPPAGAAPASAPPKRKRGENDDDPGDDQEQEARYAAVA